MRILKVCCFLVFAVVVAAVTEPSAAGQTERAVQKKGCSKSVSMTSALQAQGLETSQPAERLFSAEPMLVSETTQGQCFWWKRLTYYTDNTYTTICGSRHYYCDGFTGHGGCATPYYTATECECFEEGF